MIIYGRNIWRYGTLGGVNWLTAWVAWLTAFWIVAVVALCLGYGEIASPVVAGVIILPPGWVFAWNLSARTTKE